MSEISNYTILGTCENCSHFEVCMYKEQREEINNKVIGKIGNCYCTSFFQFTNKCTQWVQRPGASR